MINSASVDLHGSGWLNTPATLKMTSPEVSAEFDSNRANVSAGTIAGAA